MTLDLDVYVPAIALGDARSFGVWMAHAEPSVRESLRSFAAVVDVEAVLQEALLRVWQVAPRFEPDGRPNGLLRLGVRIARNLAVSEVRRTKAKPVDESDLESLADTDAAPSAPDPMLRQAIALCRDKLPPKPRQALDTRLASGGGLDDADLAESIGMRLNTFLQNFTRARQLLAECLRKRGILVEELGTCRAKKKTSSSNRSPARIAHESVTPRSAITRRGTTSTPEVASAPTRSLACSVHSKPRSMQRAYRRRPAQFSREFSRRQIRELADTCFCGCGGVRKNPCNAASCGPCTPLRPTQRVVQRWAGAMSDQTSITVGRYLLHRKIARGGMASIHIARLMGDVGFSRIVAAKRMHPELAGDAEFVAMFLDEARIASKVHHRNVVPVFDVVTMGSEVMLVQEYVHGAPLSLLLHNSNAAQAHVPIPVAASIACQVLSGLHAAHETCDEIGTPLNIVHRDVSPQNIMIALDGSARLLDFGVAKAAMSAHVTRKGTFKGKLGYSSPEQIRGEATRQSDIYSLGVVLWELIVGHRMHGNSKGEAALIADILAGKLPTITDALSEERSWIGAYRWSQLEALEPIIRKALDSNVRRRWATAADMEEAIAAAVPIATSADISQWLRAVGKDFLDERERMIAAEEQSWRRFAANGSGSLPALGTQRLELTSTATEPDHMPPSRISLRQRIPTALIAAVVVLLGMGIAFLIRDLKKNEAPPAPRVETPVATEAAPPVAKTPPAAKTEPMPAAPTTAETTNAAAGSSVEAPSDGATDETTPDEQRVPDEQRAPDEPRDVTTDPPRKKSRQAAKVRTSRPAPARTAPAARTPAPAPKTSAAGVDCSTPFYFEGKKKIFKPGCL